MAKLKKGSNLRVKIYPHFWKNERHKQWVGQEKFPGARNYEIRVL